MELSKEMQKFKIGRMSYNLPSYVVRQGDKHLLSFRLIDEGREWRACYEYVPIYGGYQETILEVYGETFNGAVKKLHAKVKELK